MPSIQSRFLRFVLNNRHLLQFRLKKDTFDWNTSIPEFRRQCEKTTKLLGKLPPGIEVSPITIDGITAEWILPSQAKKDK